MNLRMLNKLKLLTVAGLLSLGSLPAQGQGPVDDVEQITAEEGYLDQSTGVPVVIDCTCTVTWWPESFFPVSVEVFTSGDCARPNQPPVVHDTVVSPRKCSDLNGTPLPQQFYHIIDEENGGRCTQLLSSAGGRWTAEGCRTSLVPTGPY